MPVDIHRRYRRGPHSLATCIASSSLPRTFPEMHTQATDSLLQALAANKPLIEIQFPPVPNMATAALNELLDANRSFTREMMRALVPKYDAKDLNVLFPDMGEARLAKKVYGDVPFRIGVIPKQIPEYIRRPGVAVIVNPGFNISEWINIQNLVSDDSKCKLITVNADFDKVRGSYYPRFFYPGLHKAKEKILNRFEEVYYIKTFSNGGTLLRRYPEDWKLFYAGRQGTQLIWEGVNRPEFRWVEQQLSTKRTEDLVQE
ncbi:hypothetical protein FGB62_1g525 [Gracilaria domingensis]|nr:hypothetical protein FGB62_1g525 [Gracilaria domingensis]